MNVLFCNPPTPDGSAVIREGRCEHNAASFQYLMAPLSLSYCAAVVREAGHDVALVDCIADQIPLSSLAQMVRQTAYDLVVFAVTTVTFDGDAAVTRAIHEVSDAHLTAIGIHVSALPEESLADSALDSVVRGEPEYTVAALALALSTGAPLAEVEGLSFRSHTGVVHNAERPFIADLDALPLPARDLLHNARYIAPLSNVSQTPVAPARGCPYDCVYCTAGCYYGHRIRRRSPGSIVDEMQECVTRFGIGEILMWADTFTADREFVLAICAEIGRREFSPRWICNSRVDTVDPELLCAMRDAGCWAVAYGVESGSQLVLDRAHKRATLQQARDAVRWTREAGLKSMAHVIVGLPGETVGTVDETSRFLREIEPDYVQVYCAVPFPGSALYEIARDENWVITDEWSQFEQSRAVLSTPTLSADQLLAARRRIFRTFYLRPRYIVRRLAELRSAEELGRLTRGFRDFLREWVLPRR